MIQKTGIMVDTDPTFPNQTVFEQSGEQRMITAIGLEPDTTYHVKGYVVVDGERVYSNNTKQFTTAAVSYLTIKSTDSQPNWVQLNKYGSTGQNITVEYSTDGRTWTSWTAVGSASPIALELEYGESIMFRGINNAGFFYNTLNYVYFSSTGECEISGDVNTLINKYGGDITLPNNAFRRLFYNMSKATINGLILPSTTLTSSCYQEMFYGCTSLTQAPALNATTLASYCYNSMFQGCTSLTQAPALNATTLAYYCYASMFIGCTSLTQAPALNATTLASYCYSSMFQDCTSLTQAPALNATTLASYCYNNMFTGCTSLRTSPVLPATTLVTGCYRYMFYGCSSLNRIITYATTWNTSYAANWVQNVASTGDFYNLGQASNIPIDDISGVPIGWTLHTTLADYLTFTNTANGQNTIRLTKSGSVDNIELNYSKDGINWSTWNSSSSDLSITLAQHERLILYGNNPTFGSGGGGYYYFSSTATCGVSGDVNTLITQAGGDITLPNGAFYKLFKDMNRLENFGIVLPSTIVSQAAYREMFMNCSMMTVPPDLPATTLSAFCYMQMFYGCSSLTRTQITLPALQVPDWAYSGMFINCTQITSSPNIYGTPIQTVPDGGHSFEGMFGGCTLLNTITIHTTSWSSSQFQDWVFHVSATGDFYNLGGATIPTGIAGIPSGWTEHTSI